MSTQPNTSVIIVTRLVSIASLMLLSLPSSAATDQEVGAKVRACITITRDKARLRCFDAALQDAPVAEAPAAAAPAPPPATPAASSQAATAAEEFGQEQIKRSEPEAKPAPERIEALVAELSKRRDGLLTITLDNEQVWRQKSVTSLFRLREGDQVTVKRGRFGGYTLVAPGRKSTAVVRIE